LAEVEVSERGALLGGDGYRPFSSSPVMQIYYLSLVWAISGKGYFHVTSLYAKFPKKQKTNVWSTQLNKHNCQLMKEEDTV